MNSQSTNIFEMWNDVAIFTGNAIIGIDSKLQEQTSRLDAVYNNLLLSAQNEQLANVSGEKISKRQSKAQNRQVGDLFSAVPNIQLPAVSPVRKTRRQASIAASNKDDNKVEEAKESKYQISTRASRARASSTFIVDSIGVPTESSTFVDDKKVMENIDTCISPPMFPINITYIEPTKSSMTKATKKSGKKVEFILNELPPISLSTKIDIKNKSEDTLRNNMPRKKLEDIDVNNIEELLSPSLTRAMKRKLLENNKISAKKINLNIAPLTQLISTPKIPPQESFPTPHQIREIEAEKKKELYLKIKADQSKFDGYQLKATKQKKKIIDEMIKKTAEEKRQKEEKLKKIQKEKEFMMKEEALKKQKQAELKLAEINIKHLQSEKAKLLKMNCKIKKNEIKTKTQLKSEKTKLVHPKTIISNLPVLKEATLLKTKIKETETNKNDYGLDISTRDSSDDEARPKKPVPTWAKRENRKPVLEAQYFVDSIERDLFFNCPKTLSLNEMFKGWNFHDKRRTSSAVWNTLP